MSLTKADVVEARLNAHETACLERMSGINREIAVVHQRITSIKSILWTLAITVILGEGAALIFFLTPFFKR